MYASLTLHMAAPKYMPAVKIFRPTFSTSSYCKQGRIFASISMYQNRTLHNEYENSSTSPTKSRPPQSSSMLTIPNLLTSTRIALTPAIGYFIVAGVNTYAFYCFTLAAFTDLADGYIARKLNQCSQLGAILDPIADKLLMTTSFICLHNVGAIPIWLVGGFIGRDLALLGGGAVLRYSSFSGKIPSFKELIDFNKYPMPDFKPTFISKCNTVLQCLVIFIHLSANQSIGIEGSDAQILGLHLATACTTSISFGQYLSRQIFIKNPTKYRL